MTDHVIYIIHRESNIFISLLFGRRINKVDFRPIMCFIYYAIRCVSISLESFTGKRWWGETASRWLSGYTGRCWASFPASHLSIGGRPAFGFGVRAFFFGVRRPALGSGVRAFFSGVGRLALGSALHHLLMLKAALPRFSGLSWSPLMRSSLF